MYHVASSRPRAADVRSALERMDRFMEAAIRVRAFPGAAVAFGHADEEPVVRCYGHLTYAGTHRVTPQTRYDLLCVSKPLTVGALLALAVAEEGFDLESPVARTLPEFGVGGKDRVRWSHLLAHAGGLTPSKSYARLEGLSREDVVSLVLRSRPRFEAGTRSEYSCDGFVAMGLALEQRAGTTLDALVRERVLGPLGMSRAGYARPEAPLRGNVAPGAYYGVENGRTIRGRVCEKLARALGDVSGHSGLFASVEDLGCFARAWLGHVPTGRRPFFDPDVTRRFQSPVDPARLGTAALGWDTRSPEGYTVAGRAFGPRSFGHTGASGCSLWLDPDERIWVALLSNAIHGADGRRRYVHVRPRVTELAATALGR